MKPYEMSSFDMAYEAARRAVRKKYSIVTGAASKDTSKVTRSAARKTSNDTSDSKH